MSEKLVSDYTGLSFFEIEELYIDDFLSFRRDAFIYNMERNEGGREYLENAWILEQTKPDRKALRETIGERRGEDGRAED